MTRPPAAVRLDSNYIAKRFIKIAFLPDAVEDVDEDDEEGDEERHPPGHHLRLDGE